MSYHEALSSIDWTGVLEVGVPVWIAAVGGALASVIGALNRRNLKTSNGRTIAEHVEDTHNAVTRGNGMLDEISNGETPPESPSTPSH